MSSERFLLLYQRDFLGKNTGVGCHFLLQGIFLTQGSNPRLLHCGWIFYHFVTREVQELRREALKSQCSDLQEEVTAQMQDIFVREHMGLVLHVLTEAGCLGQDPMLR